MTATPPPMTVTLDDRQLRELVKWSFYTSRWLMIDTGIDQIARQDTKIGDMFAEIDAANTALQAGASAYPDGPDAFHQRFPEGFKSL